jgi:hypothetical protein
MTTPALVENAMCEAIPAASRHGWREDVGCASRSNVAVTVGDSLHYVCRMHETALERARARGGADAVAELVRKWGWL